MLAVIPVLNTNDAGPDSLRAAIIQANTQPGPDTITFAPTATGTITLTSALPDLSTDLTIVGPGPSVLTVAHRAVPWTPGFCIFTVPTGATVAISGLTITGGISTNGGGIDNSGTLTVTSSTISGNWAGYGSGIDNSGTLTVTSSTISGNRATYDGGGLFNFGTATVADCTISGNSATNFICGGGIDNRGTLTVTNSTISDNSAYIGGGIYNASTLTVTSSTISGNSAYYAGGGICGGISNADGGSVSVTNSTISDNSAYIGGGIYSASAVTVTSSTISGNSAYYDGGGIHHDLFNSVTIINSTISGNSAYFNGGGIENLGTLTVTSSTFSGNSTGPYGYGGGISSSGALTVTSSTFSGNSAGGYLPGQGGGPSIFGGGGIYSSGKATVAKSLFANVVGYNVYSVTGATFVSLGYNLFSDMPALPLDPTDLVNTNPLLAPLANYGGPTFTCALLPGSPAIDAGVPVAGVTTDQRGIARPQGSAPDIGAFESRGFIVAAALGGYQKALLGTSFAAPLVVRVASLYDEPVAGGRVTFSAPVTGPTAVLSGSPATIGADGLASVTAAASGDMGTFAVSVGARGSVGNSSFTLTNEVAIAAQGLSVTAPGSAWFTLPVVTFQVKNLAVGAPRPPASSFRAWVNWGDGTFSAGQVKLTADGTYQVVGAHRYKKGGTYRTTTQILAWPPGIVLAEVQGKVVAGGKAHVQRPKPLAKSH